MQPRRIALTVTIVFVLSSFFLLGFGPKALAQNNHDNGARCSLNLLHGNYIYGEQGLTLFGPPPSGPPFDQISAYVPFSLTGTVTFDGDGKLTSFDFSNLGAGGFPRTGTGTYAVDTTEPEFCAFNATWTFSSPPAFGLPPITIHVYIVPVRDGSVANAVVTDPGVISFHLLTKH